MSIAPVKGDVVFYHKKAYYFQPNGTSCFLYDKHDFIDSPKRARWRPSRKMVKLAPSGTIVIYDPPPEEIKEFDEWNKTIELFRTTRKSPINLNESD